MDGKTFRFLRFLEHRPQDSMTGQGQRRPPRVSGRIDRGGRKGQVLGAASTGKPGSPPLTPSTLHLSPPPSGASTVPQVSSGSRGRRRGRAGHGVGARHAQVY